MFWSLCVHNLYSIDISCTLLSYLSPSNLSTGRQSRLLPVAMPPKLTPERIQEKLAELRAYVTDHVDVLRIRPGSTVLQKLRQTASKEEKAWSFFFFRK